jgi:hypothetical protein
MADSSNSVEAVDEVPEVPKRSLSTYARLWQFETWLRGMVYVELRALRGDDWSATIPKNEKSFQSDKRLIHMPHTRDGYIELCPVVDVSESDRR